MCMFTVSVLVSTFQFSATIKQSTEWISKPTLGGILENCTRQLCSCFGNNWKNLWISWNRIIFLNTYCIQQKLYMRVLCISMLKSVTLMKKIRKFSSPIHLSKQAGWWKTCSKKNDFFKHTIVSVSFSPSVSTV